jgi:hypothetical protein
MAATQNHEHAAGQLTEPDHGWLETIFGIGSVTRAELQRNGLSACEVFKVYTAAPDPAGSVFAAKVYPNSQPRLNWARRGWAVEQALFAQHPTRIAEPLRATAGEPWLVDPYNPQQVVRMSHWVGSAAATQRCTYTQASAALADLHTMACPPLPNLGDNPRLWQIGAAPAGFEAAWGRAETALSWARELGCVADGEEAFRGPCHRDPNRENFVLPATVPGLTTGAVLVDFDSADIGRCDADLIYCLFQLSDRPDRAEIRTAVRAWTERVSHTGPFTLGSFSLWADTLALLVVMCAGSVSTGVRSGDEAAAAAAVSVLEFQVSKLHRLSVWAPTWLRWLNASR